MGTKTATPRGYTAGTGPVLSRRAFEGIEEVRLSGLTNMFDKKNVRELAEMMGYDETVDWLDSVSKEEYSRLILKGPQIAPGRSSYSSATRTKPFDPEHLDNIMKVFKMKAEDVLNEVMLRETWPKKGEIIARIREEAEDIVNTEIKSGRITESQREDAVWQASGIVLDIYKGWRADSESKGIYPKFADKKTAPKPAEKPKEPEKVAYRPGPWVIVDDHRDGLIPVFKMTAEEIGLEHDATNPEVQKAIVKAARDIVKKEIGAGRLSADQKFLAENQVAGEIYSFFREA